MPAPFPALRLFCTCWLIYAVHWAPFLIREEFPAVTLATRGTLNVERFLGWTADIFPSPAGGAFINNNPGASIVGAIPLLVAHPLLNAIERWNDTLPSSVDRSRHASRFPAIPAVQARREWYFMVVAFLTVAGLMAPVSALAASALGWTLWRGGLPRQRAIAAALIFGFATPVFVRTEYLNHNLLVCHAGLLAALVLWNAPGSGVSVRRAVAAGALGGFAVLCDYSGILALAAAAAYAWLRAGDGETGFGHRLRIALGYAAGAAPMLLALAVYQHWAFGYSALPSQHFMPAIEQTARGYRGMSWPSLELLTTNFFDTRFGLFAVCPLLALGLAAPFVQRSRFRLPDREMWLVLTFFSAFTLFCASNQYSRLQWTTGIRYLVPTIPGLLLLSLQVVDILPSAVRGPILMTSLIMAWLPAVTQGSIWAVFRNASDLQLSWIHRMAEYGALSHPVRVTAVVLVTTAAAVTVIWRRELVRAATTVETAGGE